MTERTLTITMTVSDEEVRNLLERFAARGAVNASTDAAAADDDGPVNANAPAVDANGVPWIAEVHAKTKTQNADGTWRRGKGITQEQVDAAVAKWRASQGGQAASSPTPPAMPGQPSAAPAMPGLPGAAPAMPSMPEPAPEPVSYQQIVEKYQALATAGKITAESTGAVYIRAGVTDVNELMTNESARRKLMDEFNKIG